MKWCVQVVSSHILAFVVCVQVNLLEAHPTDARLAVSGGSDGLIVLYDVDKGQVLKR